ncbi:MAG: helicase C-terminal domain-containing protein, partial [Candidatus Gracilibacteria bacterium]
KHRALDDSIAAQELFIRLIEEIRNLPAPLFKEIQSLCKKSSWEFAEVIENIKAPSTTQSKAPKAPKAPKAQKKAQPKTPETELSPTETSAIETISKAKTSQLIELPHYDEALIQALADEADKAAGATGTRTEAKSRTTILLPHYLFKSLNHPNKVGLIENYVSKNRLENFKQKSSFKTPEITALIKVLIWLEKTGNGLLTEDLAFSQDEREIIPHIQASLGLEGSLKHNSNPNNEPNPSGSLDPSPSLDPNPSLEHNLNLDHEPFIKRAIEIEQTEKVIISEHAYLPRPNTEHLIIVDCKAFIHSLQSRNGQSTSLKSASRPIQSLITLLKDKASQEDIKILTEISERLQILFGIIETTLERNTDSTSPFPQPLEITPMETSSANWQKLKDLSHSLISTSQNLANIVTEETAPYLKQWKEVLKTLLSLFAETDLDHFHVWIQKNRDEEVVTRKIPISLVEYFKKIKDSAKRFTIIDKSLDAGDDGALLRAILGISDKTPLVKIKPNKKILENSQINLVEDISGQPQENLRQTLDFIHHFITREKGRNIFIFNSIMKLEQAQMILAPKLKKEGFTLLAQRGSGGLGKILELYKASPETTSILLTPNVWNALNLPAANLPATESATEPATDQDFKNIVIHAIPFDPPSDQYLIALSKNFPDPWNEFTLPSAVLALKKMISKFFSAASRAPGISRAPGASHAPGISHAPGASSHVIILDSRIIQKSYSSTFQSALEDFVKPESATLAQLLK